MEACEYSEYVDAREAVLAEADVDDSVRSRTGCTPPLPCDPLVAFDCVDVVTWVDAETEDTAD